MARKMAHPAMKTEVSARVKIIHFSSSEQNNLTHLNPYMREPWPCIYICEAPCFTWAYYSLLCSCSKNNKRVLSWPIFACWCHTMVKGKIQVFKFWVNIALFVDCRSLFHPPSFPHFFLAFFSLCLSELVVFFLQTIHPLAHLRNTPHCHFIG